MKKITLEEVASRILEHDRFLVLMHKSPDGDAVSCAYSLCIALSRMGKQARPLCTDPIPSKYAYITDHLTEQDFEPEYIVSVDLASVELFGEKLEEYKDKVDLCIDHHRINGGFAKEGYVDSEAAACAEIMAKLYKLMNVEIDTVLANTLFTGISTDTGCFKYTNTTPETHRLAAEMIEHGADAATINRIMFDTKSRAKLELERMVLASMGFYADGKVALVCITNQMMEDSGAEDDDTDGISNLPRQIQGVSVGISVREKTETAYKISLRSAGDVDVSEICALFGGGGHKGAAGCLIKGDLESVKEKIVSAAIQATEKIG